VKPLCRLVLTLDPAIFDELPICTNGDKEWRHLELLVELQISSGELCWSATYKGINAGRVKTRVGYEGVGGY